MFVSLRLGVLVRLLLAVAGVAGVLAVVLTAVPAPRVTEAGTPEPAVQGPGLPAERVEADYRVRGTGDEGLNVRACPAVHCARIGRIGEGQTFAVTCWRSGTAVNGETRWLRGTVDGRDGFASRHYLRAHTGQGVPACARRGGDAVT